MNQMNGPSNSVLLLTGVLNKHISQHCQDLYPAILLGGGHLHSHTQILRQNVLFSFSFQEIFSYLKNLGSSMESVDATVRRANFDFVM